ncbi:FAD binding domain-containing protein [Streptomyces nojiriensis]
MHPNGSAAGTNVMSTHGGGVRGGILRIIADRLDGGVPRWKPARSTSMEKAKREPGSGYAALEDRTAQPALLGASESCVAVHPSDLAVALCAVDAVVCVRGRAGSRRIPVASLHRLPGSHPERDTVLDHGDLVTAVELPPLPMAARSRYRKVGDRASFAFALVSVAVAVDLDGGAIRDARIAFGGLATKPWRASRAERALRGAPATAERFATAAREELSAARTVGADAYKVPLARDTLVDTLLDVCGRG